MNEPRKPEYPIDPLFLDRWSPRSFDPRSIDDETLMSFFEAARWAPSSYNNQPWRFLYAKRESAEWPLFFNLLAEGNQGWAQNASALVLVISNSQFDHNGKPSITHSFDAGAAWAQFALQACRQGYVTHGMEGFDYERARMELEIPAEFTVEALIAVGKQGPKSALPEKLQTMEAPNSRRPLSQSLVSGKFTSALIHAEKREH